MQQDFNSRIRKGFSDQTHNPLVVLEKFVRVVGHLLAIVFLEQLRVNFLFRRLELIANAVLFADENELEPAEQKVYAQLFRSEEHTSEL